MPLVFGYLGPITRIACGTCGYEARGLRQEGSIYGVESQWVASGEHAVQIWLMDDEVEWRLVFDDTVTVDEDGVVRLLYNDEHDVFER